jgi:hypothetical protein
MSREHDMVVSETTPQIMVDLQQNDILNDLYLYSTDQFQMKILLQYSDDVIRIDFKKLLALRMQLESLELKYQARDLFGRLIALLDAYAFKSKGIMREYLLMRNMHGEGLFELVGSCIRSKRSNLVCSWYTGLDLYFGPMLPKGPPKWINQFIPFVVNSELSAIYTLQTLRQHLSH